MLLNRAAHPKKGGNAMRYDKPELIPLPAAIDVIQDAKLGEPDDNIGDTSPGYEDWE